MIKSFYKTPYIFFRIILNAKSQEEADRNAQIFTDLIKNFGEIIKVQREKYEKFENSYMFSYCIQELAQPMEFFENLIEDLGSHWTYKNISTYDEIFEVIWKKDSEASSLNTFFPVTKINWCLINLTP